MEDLSALLNKFFESWTFIILSGLGFTDMAVRASSNGEIRVIHTVLTWLTIAVEGLLHV
jgi:hypothetical protein